MLDAVLLIYYAAVTKNILGKCKRYYKYDQIHIIYSSFFLFYSILMNMVIILLGSIDNYIKIVKENHLGFIALLSMALIAYIVCGRFVTLGDLIP